METNPILNAALPAAIALVMCGIGLHLTLADFRSIARHPRSVLVGVAGHYLLLPLLGFGIAWLLRLPPVLAVGLVLIAACPSGTMANTLTFLARGNVALGVSLSVISALVSFLSIPLLVGAATIVFGGQGQQVPLPVAGMVRHLAGVLLVPILLGMAIRAGAPTAAQRAARWVSRFAVLLLVALIVGLAISERAGLPDALAQTGPAALMLACAAIGGGYALGRLARLSPRDVLTVSLEVGVQNAALAILIALSVLKSLPAAIPGAMYGLLMYAPALAVVAIGRRRLPAVEFAGDTSAGLRDLT
jgi:bile acid:Na+ symporter, BASS family